MFKKNLGHRVSFSGTPTQVYERRIELLKRRRILGKKKKMVHQYRIACREGKKNRYVAEFFFWDNVALLTLVRASPTFIETRHPTLGSSGNFWVRNMRSSESSPEA